MLLCRYHAYCMVGNSVGIKFGDFGQKMTYFLNLAIQSLNQTMT